jgi:hypothetical protein
MAAPICNTQPQRGPLPDVVPRGLKASRSAFQWHYRDATANRHADCLSNIVYEILNTISHRIYSTARHL